MKICEWCRESYGLGGPEKHEAHECRAILRVKLENHESVTADYLQVCKQRDAANLQVREQAERADQNYKNCKEFEGHWINAAGERDAARLQNDEIRKAAEALLDVMARRGPLYPEYAEPVRALRAAYTEKRKEGS